MPLKPEKASDCVIYDGENGCISTEMCHSETSDLKTTEKKVRFSEELLEMAQEMSDSITAEITAGSRDQNVFDEKQTAQNQNVSAEDKEMADETLVRAQMKDLSEEEEKIKEESSDVSCLSISSGHVCESEEALQTPPVELNKSCCGMTTYDSHLQRI